MGLSGKLLIAMPGMPDPRFEHAVVLVCAHSPEGAMGLIVNKPLPQPALGELMGQIGIHMTASDRGERASAGSAPILFGGPVETGRGFVLHSRDWPSARRDAGAGGMMQISEQVAMTATRDILEDIAAGEGPRLAQFALGYAGWGPGQLEGEIAANGWLVAEADDTLALDPDYATKWQRALATMGIDPRSLSATAGRA
ncbi:YqgE/AlgH family protein [Paenirhodobacter enshiensis]|uniref:YqgE/AlgH family protein n=1 Tax=Paenirhodobacter enshiensis TaxID=1105367 RepID=UPI003FA1E9E8